MNYLNFKKINKFINEGEDFSDKFILVINLDNQGSLFYLFNTKTIVNLENIFNRLNYDKKDLAYLENNAKDIKFDIVFIYNSSFSLHQENFLNSISGLQRFFKSGTRVFTFKKNKQNFIYFLKKFFKELNHTSYSLKGINLNSGKNYLVYDYYYFLYFGEIKSKKNITSRFLATLFNILNIFDMQRMFFLSSNILVKYLYVKK